MAKTQGLIEGDDPGNNSAWCYRRGLLRRRLALGPGPTDSKEPLEAWAFRLWCVCVYIDWGGTGWSVVPSHHPTPPVQTNQPSTAELLWASRLLRLDCDNASAWAHLRGLLALPDTTDGRKGKRLRRLVTDVAASHMAVGKGQEGWLLARGLVVDLQLQDATLLSLVRAKRLVERTLELEEKEAPVLGVRRGYWEVRRSVGWGCGWVKGRVRRSVGWGCG